MKTELEITYPCQLVSTSPSGAEVWNVLDNNSLITLATVYVFTRTSIYVKHSECKISYVSFSFSIHSIIKLLATANKIEKEFQIKNQL